MLKSFLNLVLFFLATSAWSATTIDAQFVSSTSFKSTNHLAGVFVYNYQITAIGGDAYVPWWLNYHVEELAPSGNPYPTATNMVSVPDTQFLNAANDWVFSIREGTTVNFTLTMMLTAQYNDTVATVVVDSIPWSTNAVMGYTSETFVGNSYPVDWQKPNFLAIQTVPEPSATALLWSVTGLALGCWRRRR